MSPLISCVAVIACVVFLNPTYLHLLTWKKPTELPLSEFGLPDVGELVVRSHLSPVDTASVMKDTLAKTDQLKPLLATEFNRDKCTVLMPSYKRTETLHEIFDHYCVMEDVIDKILIVWNNIGVPVPENLKSYKCGFPIVFLEQKKNTLNNRFRLFPEIQTECKSVWLATPFAYRVV